MRLWALPVVRTDTLVDYRRQLTALSNCAELAILFGPFVPLLLPVLAASTLLNFVAFRIGVQHFGAVGRITDIDEGRHLSTSSLRFSLTVLCVLLLLFSCSAGLAAVYPVATLFVSGVLCRLFCRHCRVTASFLTKPKERDSNRGIGDGLQLVEVVPMKKLSSTVVLPPTSFSLPPTSFSLGWRAES